MNVPVGLRRIGFLAWVEVLHVARDRATLVQVLVVPLIQLLILTNAATFEIARTPAYVVDLDRTPLSRGLITRFAASGHFRILDQAPSTDAANDALLSGAATLVLTIPHDFEAALVRSRLGAVQISVNAEKGSAAGVVQMYTATILSAYARELSADLRPTRGSIEMNASETPPARGAPTIDTRTRNWYNATLNYQHYMVPGLLVSLVTVVSTLLSAQNVAREKELGTLEQLNVTPITRGQFIAGKLLPFWVLGLVNLTLGLLVGRLVFGIPMEGSLWLLLGTAMIYLVVALAIGLWISTHAETQQQAMFVTFFILNIYLLLSGLFTPIDSMAPWVQVASNLNPVRHFVTISRAVLMKGAGLAEVAKPLTILAAYAAVMLTISVRQYSKRTA